ncbi:MAG: DNA-3-methyladenine glycosylase 2 family protein [Desulfovibrionaceae bacterium]|nr:DNA-3-methyladenine glycosylase 2 family protein [Desulfovibrionaceae bacterium]
MPRCFAVHPEAVAYLARRDKRLAWVMGQMDVPQRELMPDTFAALMHAIVGQQISGRAQAAVWARLQSGLGEVTPDAVHRAEAEALRGYGLSARKAGYMKEAAARIVHGELDLAALHSLPDEAVCAALTSLPGVGRWTAEMLLIFSLERPDVLSYGDFGIQRGLRMLYRHRQIDRARFARYRRRYSPYASLASFYLWAIAGGSIPGLTDPAS